MRLPTITGLIDRRILVNYRIDPDVAAAMLPPPFRPKLIHGQAIGGICLIRLKHVRPRFMPVAVGFTSENAAHRFAVEWDEGDQVREGVYIPRRDTDCLFNVIAGGRMFPGEQHHAKFAVKETDTHLSVQLISRDGETKVAVRGQVTEALPANSIFTNMDETSRFFERGSLGYSATADGTRYDGMELKCQNWHVIPLAIEHVESSFFEDSSRFPSGSAVFDHALLMRGIEHEWHSREDLCCEGAVEGVRIEE